MKIKLTDGMFTPREELFAEEGGLKAVLFRYESGICCVRLENSSQFSSGEHLLHR